MYVAVTGDSLRVPEEIVRKTLDAIHAKRPITRVIHNAARGTSRFAERWAKDHGIRAVAYVHHPRVFGHGRPSVEERNAREVARSGMQLLVAFTGGSDDLVRRAAGAGIRVLSVGYSPGQVREWEVQKGRRTKSGEQ